MESASTSVEIFVSNWNEQFPNYILTVADLKKPHSLIGALFQVFDKLGIDRDAVISPPPEDRHNESTQYYMDLFPAINMTRIINHLVSVMPQVNGKVTISHFLQPTATSSHSILLLLFNFMLFNEERLTEIAPHEEELFAKTDQVKVLEDKKNKLLEQLNQQAEEKGKRAERLEKLDQDIKQFEEELKQEKEVHDDEKQELEAILKENRQTEVILEQKKAHRDTLIADVARKRALRVYDADDIKAQAEQAGRDVQEAEEKLNTLRATLMQKENSLKNLQTIKPSLDTANNLLHEIMKVTESLKEAEVGDLESESQEGELSVARTELAELRATLADLEAAAAHLAERRQEADAKRQREKTDLESALREAEENDKKSQEQCKKAIQRTEEIKELTLKYKEEKATGFEAIAEIKNTFSRELKSIEDTLFKKAMEVEKNIEEKLKDRRNI